MGECRAETRSAFRHDLRFATAGGASRSAWANDGVRDRKLAECSALFRPTAEAKPRSGLVPDPFVVGASAKVQCFVACGVTQGPRRRGQRMAADYSICLGTAGWGVWPSPDAGKSWIRHPPPFPLNSRIHAMVPQPTETHP